MKTLRTIALAMGIFVSLHLPAAAMPFNCFGLLERAGLLKSSNDLRSEYLEARDKNDSTKGAKALTALMAKNRKDLGLSIKAKITLTDMSKQLRALRAWYIRYPMNTFRFVPEVLWAGFGAFAVRPLPSFAKALAGRRFAQEWSAKRAEVSATLTHDFSIPTDAFLTDSFNVIDRETRDYSGLRVRRGANKFIVPLFLTSAWINLSGLPHPVELVDFGVSAGLDESLRYETPDFFADIQKTAQTSFKGKEIVLIVDRSFMRKSSADKFADKNDPTGISNISETYKRLRSEAKSFTAISVGSVKELNEALEKTQGADIRIVNGDGLPGTILIGSEFLDEHLDEIKPEADRPGSLLIFDSCLFGNTVGDLNHPETETWKILTDRLGAERSFASLTEVEAEISDAAGDARVEQAFGSSSFFNSWKRAGASSTGLMHYDIFQQIYHAPPPMELATHQVGFRTYNRATGKILLVPHSSENK